jgi:hypothetical protein
MLGAALSLAWAVAFLAYPTLFWRLRLG